MNPDGHVGIGTSDPQYGRLQIRTEVADENGGVTWYQGDGRTARIYLKPDGGDDYDWYMTRGGSDDAGFCIRANGGVRFGRAIGFGPWSPWKDDGICLRSDDRARSISWENSQAQTGFHIFAGHGSFSDPMTRDPKTLYFRSSGGGSEERWVFKSAGLGNLFSIGSDIVMHRDAYLPVLHVTGGSDLAEPGHVSDAGLGADTIQPGMVVSIDPANPGTFVLATEAYDRKVAGVISGAGGVQPGMIMKQEGHSIGEGEHPIAMAGKVYVWCDADANGPIQPGDRLTTSPTPGHAMKVTDRDRADGAVIGKAMEALNQGTGLVLMLVQPQ